MTGPSALAPVRPSPSPGPDRSLHAPLARRRSTRAFSPQPLDEHTVALLFEAARWAPSAMNRQGWRFVVGRRGPTGADATHRALVDALAPGNRVWAASAPVLIAALAPTDPPEASAPDVTAAYELGLAVAHLETQAQALGLVSHQMGGFSRDAVTSSFAVPTGWAPMVVVSVGHPGDVADLPAELARREAAPRARRSLRELVFSGRWQSPALPSVDVGVAVA